MAIKSETNNKIRVDQGSPDLQPGLVQISNERNLPNPHFLSKAEHRSGSVQMPNQKRSSKIRARQGRAELIPSSVQKSTQKPFSYRKIRLQRLPRSQGGWCCNQIKNNQRKSMLTMATPVAPLVKVRHSYTSDQSFHVQPRPYQLLVCLSVTTGPTIDSRQCLFRDLDLYFDSPGRG